MAKNYKNISYFQDRPDVVRIFDDLDKLLDFCRFEMMSFNEADLYNRHSRVWQAYEGAKRGRKPWNGERKPYQGKNPRYNNEQRFSH